MAQDKWAYELEWVDGTQYSQPWQCLKVLEHILQRDSTQAEAYRLKAHIVSKWGWWAQAMQCYEAALRYRPEWGKDARWMTQKLSAERQGKAYAKAHVTIDILINYFPEKAQYYEDKSFIFRLQNQYASSLEWLNKAIELDPNKSTYHAKKAFIYGYVPNDEAALAAYKLALKKSPLDPEAQPEKYRQEITHLQNQLQYQRGRQDRVAGKLVEIATLTKQIEAQPDDYELYWKRAIKYDQSGLHQKAGQDYQKTLTFDIRDLPQEVYWTIWQQKARNESNLGLYAQALASIHLPLEQSHQASTFLFTRYSIYYFAGEYAKALIDIEVLVQREPTNGIYLEARADTKLELGDYRGALQDYEQLVEAGDSVEDFKIRKCKLGAGIIFDRAAMEDELSNLFIFKHLDSLLARLDTYQQQRPQEKAIYYYRALAYAQYHKYDLAQKAFRKALEIASEYRTDLKFMKARADNLHYGKYYQEAIQAYEDMQQNIVGQGSYTSLQMGKIYIALDDQVNAYAQFNVAVHMAKDLTEKWDAYYERGMFYLHHFHSYKKAEKDFMELSKTAAGLAQEPLAEAREMLQYLKTADEIEDQLKDPAVKNRDSLLVKRARALYEANYFGAAWKDFEQAAQINPEWLKDLDFAFYWADTGCLGEMQDQYPKVIEILKKAVEHHPQEDDLWSLLGRVYLTTQQYCQSVAAYDRMIGQTNHLDDYVEVLAERGKAKVGLKDYEGAWRDFTDYLDRHPVLEYFVEKELKTCREQLKKD